MKALCRGLPRRHCILNWICKSQPELGERTLRRSATENTRMLEAKQCPVPSLIYQTLKLALRKAAWTYDRQSFLTMYTHSRSLPSGLLTLPCVLVYISAPTSEASVGRLQGHWSEPARGCATKGRVVELPTRL